MYGSDWNWCDAVQAIGTFLTPILGLGAVKHWVGKKLSEKIDREEKVNMGDGGESNEAAENLVHDFWQLVQRNVTMLKGRSIPTRRFWSVPHKSGIRLVYVVLESAARVELYIDNGDEEWNLRTYNGLLERKEEIEKQLKKSSGKVVWFARPNSRAKGIGLEYDDFGLSDKDGWVSIIDFYKTAAPLLIEVIS